MSQIFYNVIVSNHPHSSALLLALDVRFTCTGLSLRFFMIVYLKSQVLESGMKDTAKRSV